MTDPDEPHGYGVALRTLTSGLAHEVRNPINAAKLQLEMLDRRLCREHDEIRFRDPVAAAMSELDRLTRLLDDFLAFAQPTALRLEDIDLVVAVREGCEHEQALARELGVTLEFTASEPTVAARVDRAKVLGLLRYLVRNALEVTPAGTAVTVCVSVGVGVGVSTTVAEDVVVLEIADHGPGIPAGDRARIYEPFFTTKESGTGLGMSIAQSIVTQHRGSIRFESGPAGTRFYVRLPRRP